MEYLPKELLFSVPPTASASTRSYDTIIRPSGGTGPYVAGQDVRFEIPRGKAGTCIDAANCYVSFKARATAADATFDGGPWAAIDRVNVYSGSTIVESIRDYGFIHGSLHRLLSPLDSGITANGISINPQNSKFTPTLTEAQVQASSVQMVPEVIRAGATVGNLTATQVAETSPFQFPLVSGVLGSTAGDRYFPLSLTAAGLTLELTLSDDKMALVSVDATNTFELSDMRLHMRYVELGDGVMDQIVASQGGVSIQIPSESYTAVNTSPIAANSTSHSAILPLRYRSLKTILACMRQVDSVAMDKHGLASTSNGYAAHQFRVNGAPVPYYKVQGLGQAWRALMQAYHMDQGVGGAESSVTFASWASDSDGDAFETIGDADYALLQGSFCMAADCELFRGKGSLIYNGKETLTSNVELQIEFGDAGATADTSLTTIAHYDTLLSIDVMSGEVSVAY